MVLQKRRITQPLAGPVDDKTDAKLSQGLEEVLNGYYDEKNGRVDKRVGTQDISSGNVGSTTTLAWLASVGAGYIVGNDERLYTGNSSGVAPYALNGTTDVPYQPAAVSELSELPVSGADLGTATASVSDDGSKVAIASITLDDGTLNSFLNFKIAEVGTDITEFDGNIRAGSAGFFREAFAYGGLSGTQPCVFYRTSGNNIFVAQVVDGSLATALIASNATSLDVCRMQDDSGTYAKHAVLVWYNNVDNGIYFLIHNGQGTTLAAQTQSSLGGTVKVASYAVNNRIYLAAITAGAATLYRGRWNLGTASFDFTGTVAPTFPGTFALASSDAPFLIDNTSIYLTCSDGTYTNAFGTLTIDTSAGQKGFLQGWTMSSKPVLYKGNKIFAMTSAASSSNAEGFHRASVLCALDGGSDTYKPYAGTSDEMPVPLSPLLRLNSGLSPTFSSTFSVQGSTSITDLVDDTVYLGLNRLVSGTDSGSSNVTQEGAVALSCVMEDRTLQRVHTPAPEGLAVTHGGVMSYDTSVLHETGFLSAPRIVDVSFSGGGTDIGAGDVQVVAHWVYTDDKGNEYRGPLSNFVTENTGAGADSITVVVQDIGMTYKQLNRIRLAIYRTQANSTIFRQIENLALLEDPADLLTVTSTQTDTNILDNTQLYTQLGELGNDCPPPSTAVAEYDQRLITANKGSDVLSYSKIRAPRTPYEFPPEFTFSIEAFGGDIIGLATLDNTLVIFKETAIYALQGVGPNNDGSGPQFAPPRLIRPDLGCIENRSIVRLPEGILFKSNDGFRLVTRGLTVEDLESGSFQWGRDNIVDAAVADGDDQTVVLYSDDTENALALHYRSGVWAEYTNHQAKAADKVGADIFRLGLRGAGDYSILAPDAGSYADAHKTDTTYQLKVTTGWYKLAGLQGFQRIYRAQLLGDYVGAHTLNFSVSYNYDDTIIDNYSIDATTNLNTVNYQPEIRMNKQKCESVKFVISDTPNNTGSMSLNALDLEVGVKRSGWNKGQSVTRRPT